MTLKASIREPMRQTIDDTELQDYKKKRTLKPVIIRIKRYIGHKCD